MAEEKESASKEVIAGSVLGTVAVGAGSMLLGAGAAAGAPVLAAGIGIWALASHLDEKSKSNK